MSGTLWWSLRVFEVSFERVTPNEESRSTEAELERDRYQYQNGLRILAKSRYRGISLRKINNSRFLAWDSVRILHLGSRDREYTHAAPVRKYACPGIGITYPPSSFCSDSGVLCAAPAVGGRCAPAMLFPLGAPYGAFGLRA